MENYEIEKNSMKKFKKNIHEIYLQWVFYRLESLKNY